MTGFITPLRFRAAPAWRGLRSDAQDRIVDARRIAGMQGPQSSVWLYVSAGPDEAAVRCLFSAAAKARWRKKHRFWTGRFDAASKGALTQENIGLLLTVWRTAYSKSGNHKGLPGFFAHCTSKTAGPKHAAPLKRNFRCRVRKNCRRHPCGCQGDLTKLCAEIPLQGRCFLTPTRLKAGHDFACKVCRTRPCAKIFCFGRWLPASTRLSRA